MPDSRTSQFCQVTAIVTAYQRIGQTLTTLQRIQECRPRPDEIIIHVDANQEQCAAAIHQAYPDLRIILSQDCIGPGGGRNKLIAAAKNELVASFDDDSYPVDPDYFARVLSLFERFPAAAIISAAVYHQGETISPEMKRAEWTADFSGGACIYRRGDFLQTGGYVPLPVAYGMEEVDLALRLHALGGRLLKSPWLRVFHATDLVRHASPQITASSISNLALLAYLRYPVSLWGIGVLQCINRIIWLLRHRRWQGIGTGILMIPAHLSTYRCYRLQVKAQIVRSYLTLRRSPINEVF